MSLYVNGENDQRLTIPRSELLMLDVVKSTYKGYCFVPYKYQNGVLPKATKFVIEQVKLPRFKYAAVRRAVGEVNDDQVLANVDALKKILQGTAYARAANRDQFTFILYDESFKGGYEVLIWFD